MNTATTETKSNQYYY